jgi:hypothetical protein
MLLSTKYNTYLKISLGITTTHYCTSVMVYGTIRLYSGVTTTPRPARPGIKGFSMDIKNYPLLGGFLIALIFRDKSHIRIVQ